MVITCDLSGDFLYLYKIISFIVIFLEINFQEINVHFLWKKYCKTQWNSIIIFGNPGEKIFNFFDGKTCEKYPWRSMIFNNRKAGKFSRNKFLFLYEKPQLKITRKTQ